MSEADLSREPIELVELVLPKCINTYGVSPCAATGAAGSECFNCRATCQDVTNYRDTPDRQLTADLTLANGETIASGDLTRTASLFAAFSVRFTSDPSGIIWEQGGSADEGAYLGVTSGNLVFRAGDGTAATGAGVGKVSVDVAAYAGKSLTLYTEIEFTASSTSTVRLWSFDPVEFTLTLIGSDDFTAGSVWAGTDGGAIGELGGSNAATGEAVTAWDGSISIANFYDNQAAPADMSDGFRQNLFLGRGVKGEPTAEVYILPTLTDVGTIGTQINLNGFDDNYQPLGRRATLDFTCRDFTHSDITQDPYYATRLYDPFDRSTFWRKWLQRQKFGKVGAFVRVHDGYADEALSAYRRRTYVLDKVDYNEESIAFHCRDVLTRTEFSRAQVPVASTGTLFADIDNAVTAFAVTGDVTTGYPAAGTVRINDEIMTYTARAFATDRTNFTGVTRGTDGSTADDQDIDDLVQTCRRYTGAGITEVITELLVDDSQIQGQLVDLAGIASEDASYLSAYTLTTLITEPTSVSNLLGKLSEECSFYIWWGERSQQIKMQAIRGIGATDVQNTWTYEANIVAGSFRLMEKPKQRLNIINFYYNPIDFAGDLNKPVNYKNALQVVNGTTSLPEQYGNFIQQREIFSRWLITAAVANQTTARLAVRYADVPNFSEFYVDAKDRATWVGDIVTISHPLIVDILGERVLRRWLIVEAEEVDPGHLVRYVCADITLDGSIFTITENGIGTYTSALFADGNFFITDSGGLNPDGTTGATIS